MDFLKQQRRKKVIRTTLYEDQEFTRWELEILHTPVVQRLYNLKQLGFADRIYPDAVHSRLNHLIGVVEVVDRMALHLGAWLEDHAKDEFTYGSDAGTSTHQVTGAELAAQIRSKLSALRIMGLLHDLSHAAFGHTLEDEVCVFDEKHDTPRRQARFFNALVAQLLYTWCTEQRIHDADPGILEQLSGLAVNRADVERWAEELAEHLSSTGDHVALAQRLRELELAFRLMLHLEFMHGRTEAVAGSAPGPQGLLVTEVALKLHDGSQPIDFQIHRDAFIIDMVGNTICADLLDYARRDATNSGLKIQFDERVLRYLSIVSVDGELSPTGKACLRLAMQFFTYKMRYDVLSEMSGILKARYLINERVVFHPTKCAAGAMLGAGAQLLGLDHLPDWMLVLGDVEFLHRLSLIARGLQALCEHLDSVAHGAPNDWPQAVNDLWPADPRMREAVTGCVHRMWNAGASSGQLSRDDVERMHSRVRGAQLLLWKLSARRFHKLAFRLRGGIHHSGAETDETIAKKYCQPGPRYDLERRIEHACHLPVGSVLVHCPKRRTSMKVAEVLVWGDDPNSVARLRDLTKVSPEGLQPYENEIRAVEEMYKSIWQFHAYLDSAWFDKQPVVAWALEDDLGFHNDLLLKKELAHETFGPYSLIADMHREVPIALLPQVVERVDAQFSTGRLRDGTNHKEVVASIVREVMRDAATQREGLAAEKVPTGRGLAPTAPAAELEVTLSLQPTDGGDGQDRFLFICKSHLKRSFPTSESELRSWYQLNVHAWPEGARSAFLDELEESVERTPQGSQRRAAAGENTSGAKLLTFLESLANKHRPG